MTARGGFWMGLLIGIGGAFLLAHRVKRLQEQVIHFTDDGDSEKNFGAFPPDIPDDYLEAPNFV